MKGESVLNDLKLKLMRCLISVYLRLPVKPFQGILSQIFLRYRRAGKDKVVITKVDGIKFSLDLNESIDSFIYHTGTYEPMTVAFANKYLKPGMTAFDVGANIGWYTLRFAGLVRENGRVIAFEPMSQAFLKLKSNVELNEFQNIILEKLALSDTTQEGQACFFHSWRLDVGGLPNTLDNEEAVSFVTLDEYVSGNHLDRIDLIKIDVEGYEHKVIQGGLKTIQRLKPTMIIEFNRPNLSRLGYSLDGLIDLLGSLGYSFYSERDMKRYSSRESLLKAVPEAEAVNVICLRDNSHNRGL